MSDLDSEAGGDEDSDCSCIHVDDKPEPDGVIMRYPNALNDDWKFYEDVEYGKELKNAERKEVWTGSTVRDFFEEADSREELIRRVEKLCGIEVYGRRTDKERGGDL